MAGIGGFFVKLGMQVDKSSFAAGEAALKGFQSLAGGVAKALGVSTGSMLAMAKAAGAMESAELKMARSIGISASALDSWKIAAGIAGTSGAALIGTMNQLETKMQRLKLGQVDMGLARNLSFLGMNYSDFAKMNSEQRMAAVFGKAGSMQDQEKAALLISETLGSGALDFYNYMKLSGKSLSQMLAEGRALNFTTERSKREAAIFNQEINAVAQGAKSIATFFGSNIAAKLTPAVSRIKEILISNKELIQSGIIGFADRLGAAINGVIGFASKIAPLVGQLINRFGGLDKVIVKVGIGIGALKLAKVAGGIASVVQSVGLLKLALGGITKGLLAGGLYLLFDDLMTYMQYPDDPSMSVIGYIVNNLDELKKKLAETFPSINLGGLVDSVKELGKAFEKLFSTIIHSDSFKESLRKIADFLGGTFLTAITDNVKMLGDFVNIVGSLMSGDMKGAMEAAKQLGKDIAAQPGHIVDNLNNAIDFEERGQAAIDRARERKEKGEGLIQLNPAITGLFSKDKPAPAPTQAQVVSKEEADARLKTMGYGRINDGIMRPDGTVTQVAPDDWVFAVRSLGDLAAAFVPGGASNSVSAPATYTINQHFSFSGNATPAAVRREAYSGANDALMHAMNNSQRILQLMPGQR